LGNPHVAPLDSGGSFFDLRVRGHARKVAVRNFRPSQRWVAPDISNNPQRSGPVFFSGIDAGLFALLHMISLYQGTALVVPQSDRKQNRAFSPGFTLRGC
jgi:hypothetical protein